MVKAGKKKKTNLEVWNNESESWDLRKIADKIELEDSFRYISNDDTDRLFVFEAGIWKEKGESIVRKRCLEVTNELLRANNIKQVERIIKTRNEVYADQEGLETKDYLIPFQNGVYDLREQEFREFKQQDNLKWKNNVYYIEDETAEKILDIDREKEEGKVDEFLETIVDTHRKKQTLKETIGLGMMTNYPIDEGPILHGKGSNGKGMFVELMKKIVGDWHAINLNEATDDKFASATLEGCGFVFFDELGHIKNPQKIKSYTGDEDMNVRRMQSEPEMGKQTAVPVMATNELPTPPEQTDGWFRRFPIIDFPYKFTEPTKNDGNKDKKNPRDIEEEYFNMNALSLFATKLVDDMVDVVENSGFTESFPTQIKRQRWNMKSSIVYTFLDLFVEQGDKPDQSSTTQADTIRKDKLLEMCNDFIEMSNETKIRSHELTQAIKNNPDLETGIDQRVELEDGTETRAYSGLRLVLPSFQDSQWLADLEATSNLLLLRYKDMFDVARPLQSIQVLGVAESEVIAEVLELLKLHDKDKLNLLKVIRELNLSNSDVERIYESDFVNVDGAVTEGFGLPDLSINQENFNKAIEESDELIKEKGELKRPARWLDDEIKGWSIETEKDVEDLLEKAVEKGFSYEKTEKAVNNLIGDGTLMEPKPGKVKKT